MNTAILNIKMDPKTKERLKIFASQLGLPVSALINAQIKQMLRTGKVELDTTLEPTPYLIKLVKKAEADYKAGRNVITLNGRDELKDYLKTL